ncbi:sulfatase-like hydrolase/transferase [Botrimarina hoheduenensis]|uniref:sulfatase-like hydrolase/transferase n=1 Tax=Botrimarina hoheduenensis TaxID=2528000 RepID=UPI0011B819A7|nr:sulfatase-like hydrolase/transferase [Botrimarina hoheduenensis]
MGRARRAFAQLTCGAGTPPNVLVVITDDLGWGDLSSHGSKQLETPNLDRLRAEGVSFIRFYVQPVCAPTQLTCPGVKTPKRASNALSYRYATNPMQTVRLDKTLTGKGASPARRWRSREVAAVSEPGQDLCR